MPEEYLLKVSQRLFEERPDEILKKGSNFRGPVMYWAKKPKTRPHSRNREGIYIHSCLWEPSRKKFLDTISLEGEICVSSTESVDLFNRGEGGIVFRGTCREYYQGDVWSDIDYASGKRYATKNAHAGRGWDEGFLVPSKSQVLGIYGTDEFCQEVDPEGKLYRFQGMGWSLVKQEVKICFEGGRNTIEWKRCLWRLGVKAQVGTGPSNCLSVSEEVFSDLLLDAPSSFSAGYDWAHMEEYPRGTETY